MGGAEGRSDVPADEGYEEDGHQRGYEMGASPGGYEYHGSAAMGEAPGSAIREGQLFLSHTPAALAPTGEQETPAAAWSSKSVLGESDDVGALSRSHLLREVVGT